MLEIDLSQPSAEFKSHLALEDNNRIIFSGIFGIGKTHFLKNYFEKNKEEYIAIHLFPVNYSVSKNEDIFELIKTDVIYEILLNPSFNGKKIKFDDDLLLSFYLANNAVEIVGKFVEFVPEIGKSVSQVIEKSSDLIKKFKSFKKDMVLDEKKELFDYLKEKRKAKGGIYESDFYTNLIIKALDELAFIEKGKARKKVLIIDDLDRIDPEHIFRLLNIFSAHFDLNGRDENKFGFDEVIFVCDIKNIRNIFNSKYGADVDFNGYIDKFYSREIFYFDNKKAIENCIEKLLNSLSLDEVIKSRIIRNEFLTEVLTTMIYANAINLRSLTKLEGKIFNINRNEMIFLKGIKENIFPLHYDVLLVFKFLNAVFGNAEALINALEIAARFKLNNDKGAIQVGGGEEVAFMGELLIFLDYKSHMFKEGLQVYRYLADGGKSIQYTYSLKKPSRRAQIDLIKIETDVKDQSGQYKTVTLNECNLFDHILAVGKLFSELKIIK